MIGFREHMNEQAKVLERFATGTADEDKISEDKSSEDKSSEDKSSEDT
jgi:hypothetical protein